MFYQEKGNFKETKKIMPPTGISLDEADHHHDYKSYFEHKHVNGNNGQLMDNDDGEEDDIYAEVRKITRYRNIL